MLGIVIPDLRSVEEVPGSKSSLWLPEVPEVPEVLGSQSSNTALRQTSLFDCHTAATAVF